MLVSTQQILLEIIFWLYFINSIVLIIHEIDSAYRKEWELFKIKGGIASFLVVHLPLLVIVLYGLIEVYAETGIGLIFSLILCFGGFFTFSIHIYFLRKGREEFKSKISKFILFNLLFISLVQFVITIIVLFTPILYHCAFC